MPLNDNAKKWVEALRSGRFKQAKQFLHIKDQAGDSYCCLGVACELAVEAGVVRRIEDNDRLDFKSVVYGGDRGMTSDNVLPPEVQDWLGIRSATGELTPLLDHEKEPLLQTLAAMNDRGKTFNEIADLIESEPEGLFVQNV